MSSAKPKPVDPTLVIFEKIGDTRPTTVTHYKGDRIALETRGTMVVQQTILIDATEVYEYQYPETKSGARWRIKSYEIDSIRLPPSKPPSLWRRFWAWLLVRPLPTAIPTAMIAKESSHADR